MNKKIILIIGVIGSIASIVGLLVVLFPNDLEKTVINTTQNQSGSNNVQAGEKIVINNYSNKQPSKPIFIHREEIEGPYINEWYAQPLTSVGSANSSGLTVLILGEGKTVEFSGILNFKCDGKQKSWRSVQNFYQTITDESEITQIVPEAVYHTICRLFYHKPGTYAQ